MQKRGGHELPHVESNDVVEFRHRESSDRPERKPRDDVIAEHALQQVHPRVQQHQQ